MDGWERENARKHQRFDYTYSPSLFVTINFDTPVAVVEYSAVARNIHSVAGITAVAVRRIVTTSRCPELLWFVPAVLLIARSAAAIALVALLVSATILLVALLMSTILLVAPLSPVASAVALVPKSQLRDRS